MHKPAPSLMLKDPFIADLVERGWKEAIIMKSYPHSHYHFHIDLNNRPAAINLLLGKNENCHTVFIGEQYYRNQSRAIELKYEYGHFYLVNTTKNTVFSISEQIDICLLYLLHYSMGPRGMTVRETR